MCSSDLPKHSHYNYKMMIMKKLEVKKLEFAYGRNQILFEFDFSLEESQIGCLLGPSGCGKTTSLRAIAGFENPTKGEIILNGKKLSGPKIFVEPEKRQIGMVFQDIALFPHLSVKENIQFGIRSLSTNLREKRSNELLDLVGMQGFTVFIHARVYIVDSCLF